MSQRISPSTCRPGGSEGVVVEVVTTVDAGLVGERLGELRAELRLGEDGLDAGRLDRSTSAATSPAVGSWPTFSTTTPTISKP